MSTTPIPVSGPLHAVQVLGGGAGAHVRSLAAGLVARGVRVTVCGPAAAEGAHGFSGTGARFAPVEIARRGAPRADAAVVSALRSACAAADVVHAHGLRAGLLASLALGGRRTPLVVTWHTTVHADGARARLLRWLERRVVRAAAVVLGASTDLVDRARLQGARDARLTSVVTSRTPPGGLRHLADVQDGRKTRAELGAVERPLLVAVGRLESNRGFGSLLDACRGWLDRDPQPLLIIAGEGSQRTALARRIDAEKLPVRLTGRCHDVAGLVAAADVVVLPSRWEARSPIAQEALRAGVPLVATAVGGTPDLVGDAAVLVPYGDPVALARAVAALLDDPARRAGLAASGRRQAAGWPSEDDTVAQVLSVYDELTRR